MNVGGDISGLRNIGNLLGKTPSQLDDSARRLGVTVDNLVHDAGWKGDAADSFSSAWGQDAAAMTELSNCAGLVAEAVTTLAAKLSDLQNQLDGAIFGARQQGVPVNADGSVPEIFANSTAVNASVSFLTESTRIQAEAKAARDEAMAKLYTVLAAIDANAGGGPTVLSWADVNALAPVLRGYYALPIARIEGIETKTTKALRELQTAKDVLAAADSSAAAAMQEGFATSRDKAARALGKLVAAETFAEHFKGGKLLSTSVGEVAKGIGALSQDSKLAGALDNLPGLDVAAAVGATLAQMKEDTNKGWSTGHALLADGGSNLAGLVAGVACDAIPCVGKYISPAVSYGVGSFVYEATHAAHWTENIHDHGVVMGTLDSAGEAGKAVWSTDVVGMADKVGDAATHPLDTVKNVWGGIVNSF